MMRAVGDWLFIIIYLLFPIGLIGISCLFMKNYYFILIFFAFSIINLVIIFIIKNHYEIKIVKSEYPILFINKDNEYILMNNPMQELIGINSQSFSHIISGIKNESLSTAIYTAFKQNKSFQFSMLRKKYIINPINCNRGIFIIIKPISLDECKLNIYKEIFENCLSGYIITKQNIIYNVSNQNNKFKIGDNIYDVITKDSKPQQILFYDDFSVLKTISHNIQQYIFDTMPISIALFDEQFFLKYSNNSFNNLFPKEKNIFSFFEEKDFLLKIIQDPLVNNNFQIFTVKNTDITLYIQIIKCHSGIILTSFPEDYVNNFRKQVIHSDRIQSLGEIVGSVSHDFNNIITSILGLSDLIINRRNLSHISEDWTDIMRIRHEASKGGNLIKQILNLSRKHNDQTKNINVNDFIEEFLNTIGRLLGSKIKTTAIKDISSPQIKMNEISLFQVLVNLSLNARDAMPNGGRITITIKTITIGNNIIENRQRIKSGEYVEIALQDMGSGIPTQYMDKIFEPFFTTKGEKGNGFGLSIVRSIINTNNGFLRIVSKENIGTIFKIYIPRYFTFKESKLQQSNSKNLKVLFVDDEASILIFASRGLKLKGIDVFECISPEIAIETANNSEHLDVLVTDMMMGSINGIALFKKIREKIPRIKVIFTSGYAKEDLKLDEINNNFDSRDFDFLSKPYSLNDLYVRITSICSN